MEIKIDLKFWFEMIRFIIISILLIALASYMSYFSEIFQSVETELTGILLWVLFMLYALGFYKTPHFKKKVG